MMRITILGSTGSIGKSSLNVIAHNPDLFQIFALGAYSNVELLAQQCQQFRPRYVVLIDPIAAQTLQRYITQHNLTTQVLVGNNALCEIAAHAEVETVIAAIVGAAGLLPTFAAVRAGKRILLANKEVLVMAGQLFMQETQRTGAEIIPVDSEHNAIFQCLPNSFKTGTKPAGVKRLLLTASGGPFRNLPLPELANVTIEQACAHPNWQMGQKVSVDSATMMNKALEVIEAYWLFKMEANEISVLLHPQSIIHSLVEFQDASVLAQLGNPDMRIPIACALAWPERIASGAASLDLIKLGQLNFEAISYDRYPCLQLAYDALKTGGTATTILNAANEVAVQAFLAKQIAFTAITAINQSVLEKISAVPADSIEIILQADKLARSAARDIIRSISSAVIV